MYLLFVVFTTFLIYLCLTEEYFIYNIALVSTKHQHESAIDLPMFPPILFN